MSRHTTPIAAALAALLLTACATPQRPRPIGAVVPMEGGRYQSTVSGSEQAQVLKTFTHDAEATCWKEPAGQRMPWDSKPAPPKYTVVSQNVKAKDAQQIASSGNKLLDAGIAVGLRREGLESKGSVEVTTVFRCD